MGHVVVLHGLFDIFGQTPLAYEFAPHVPVGKARHAQFRLFQHLVVVGGAQQGLPGQFGNPSIYQRAAEEHWFVGMITNVSIR